jgi:hypothetical protein
MVAERKLNIVLEGRGAGDTRSITYTGAPAEVKFP